MAEQYKSIKVPTWVYDDAQRVRADLVRRGIGVVPDKLLRVLGGGGESLGLGTVLGLGVTALADALEVRLQSEKASRKPTKKARSK